MNTYKEEGYENPYRYGALVGNWVEERFGKELASRNDPRSHFTTSYQANHSKNSTVHNAEPAAVEPEFNPSKVSQSGVDRHLFFGHGAVQDEFENRDLRSTYELSMLRKIPAHVTVQSKFIPPPLPEKDSGSVEEVAGGPRKPKAYHEFTKRCDATFNKVGFRK
jgi:hypothetical protein